MEKEQEKELIPLWQFQPDVPRYSIGWRMGRGEEYRFDWWSWFDSLDQSQKSEYISKYPEPEGWKGFYAKQHPDFPE